MQQQDAGDAYSASPLIPFESPSVTRDWEEWTERIITAAQQHASIAAPPSEPSASSDAYWDTRPSAPSASSAHAAPWDIPSAAHWDTPSSALIASSDREAS